jgi:hypothetical protein
MARNFYRALVYSSLFAGIGSFLIAVGQAADRISAFVTSKLQELSAADRDWTISTCLLVIVLSALGLAIIQLFRGGRGN